MTPGYLIFLALGFSLIQPHFRNRTVLLFTNILVALSYALALYAADLHMGALVYAIVIVGTMSQMLLPDGPRIQYLRVASAMICVLVGAALLYKTPLDLFAVGGFTLARMGETMQRPVHIKAGYMLGAVSYIAYSSLNGAYMVSAAQLAFIVSALVAIALEKTGRRGVFDMLSLAWPVRLGRANIRTRD